MSDYEYTSSTGYFSSPYSVPPTFSLSMSYFLYTYIGPTPCGSDIETQDDRFPLPQPGERQMSVTGVRQMLALGESQGLEPGGSHAPISGETQVPLAGQSQGRIWGRARCPMRGTL